MTLVSNASRFDGLESCKPTDALDELLYADDMDKKASSGVNAKSHGSSLM